LFESSLLSECDPLNFSIIHFAINASAEAEFTSCIGADAFIAKRIAFRQLSGSWCSS